MKTIEEVYKKRLEIDAMTEEQADAADIFKEIWVDDLTYVGNVLQTHVEKSAQAVLENDIKFSRYCIPMFGSESIEHINVYSWALGIEPNYEEYVPVGDELEQYRELCGSAVSVIVKDVRDKLVSVDRELILTLVARELDGFLSKSTTLTREEVLIELATRIMHMDELRHVPQIDVICDLMTEFGVLGKDFKIGGQVN